MSNMKALAERQGERNDALLKDTQFLGDEIASDVLGLHIDIATIEVAWGSGRPGVDGVAD